MSASKIRFARVWRVLRVSRMLWVVACIALALMLSMGNTLRAYAAPGDLDTTFGGDGRVTTDFVGVAEHAEAVAIQSDGKIVAAGHRAVTTFALDFAVARYNTNGSLDTSFSGDGKVHTDFFGGADRAYAVAIQSNGKIVVGGSAIDYNTEYFALARYNTDGSLDTSFSGDGKVHTDFGGTSHISALAIQSDGKIIAVGFGGVEGRGFAVARYNSNGSLDTSFSGNGKLQFGFGSNDFADAVAIQPDGKIVVAGSAGTNIGTDFAIARLTTGGGFDLTFGGDGKVTTAFPGNYAIANAVAIQSDGKVVAGGYAFRNSTGGDFALARYKSDGTLDTTFSNNGKLTTDFGSYDIDYGLAIQSDGKIVAAGSDENDFALARYNPDGSLDTSLSDDGKVTTDFAGSFDGAYAVAIQSDGKIVAAGSADNASGAHFGLARYEGVTHVPPMPSPTSTVTRTATATRTATRTSTPIAASPTLTSTLVPTSTALPTQTPSR